MSGRLAVDAFTIGLPASIEARHAQGVVRQHLAHDRGEPWQCGVERVHDGELAEQFQRAVEICALKIRTVGSAFFHGQHRDSLLSSAILCLLAGAHNLPSGAFVGS